MKIKTLIILFLICIGVLIPPVLSYDLQYVSITEGGNQFISIPMSKNVVYSYESSIPDGGILILSLPNENTYLVDTTNYIKMVTVKKETPKNIIEIILGWL
jgi:hypothetical protein